MRRRGKKYQDAIKLVDRTKHYSLKEAVDLVQKVSYTKFKGSMDLTMRLGVDPRHADQNVRGATALPHGSGKTARIVIFAKGQKAIEGTESGVEFVGGDDLAAKISEGWLEFEHVIATPDMMGVVGRLGKVLGPRGLMPNPKLGTVTFDIKNAVAELKRGRAEFKVDKGGVIHTSVGRVSMSAEQLKENIEAVVDAVNKAKPSGAKGTYLVSLGVSATMSPGVKVDPAPFR